MYLDKEWLEELLRKHGKHPKQLRDALWPENINKGLGYFNKTKNITLTTIEQIADVIGCSTDELLRRPSLPMSLVTGNNNQVGNVTVTNDPEALHQIIAAQRQIIEHQNSEIKRMETNMHQQLKVKDAQIDRLIKLAQNNGNQ